MGLVETFIIWFVVLLFWCLKCSEVVFLGAGSCSSVSVGVVLDKASAEQLVVCPYLRKVLFSRGSALDVVRSWNQCFVGGEHCDLHGRWLKFESFGVDSLRVVWQCPRAIGLPNSEI